MRTTDYFQKPEPLDECRDFDLFVPAAAQYVEIADKSIIEVNTAATQLGSGVYQDRRLEFGGTAFQGDSVVSFTAVSPGSTKVRLLLWNGDTADGYGIAFQDFNVIVQ